LLVVLLVVLAAVAVATMAKVHKRAPLTRRQYLGIALLAAAVAYASLYMLLVPGHEAVTLSWHAWYLSWPLVLLLPVAVVDAAALRQRRAADGAAWFVVCVFLAAAVQQLHNPQDQDFGLHLWTMRRFIPVIVPAIILMVTATVVRACRRAAMGRVTAVAVLGGLLVLVAWPSPAVVRQPFWEDGALMSRELAEDFPEDAVVLVGRDLAGTHVQTTIDYLHGVDAVLVQRAPDAGVWAPQIARWLAAGRRTFLLAGRADTHIPVRGLSLRAFASRRLQVTLLETTTGRLPRRPATRRLALDAYEFVADAEASERAVVVGNYSSDALFRLEGFHLPEIDAATGATFRWTRARAAINVPRAPAYVVRLSGARPAGAPAATVRILLDGREVQVSQLPSGPVDVTVRNPGDVGDGDVLLEILAPTFNPLRLGISDDGRNLGVRVYSIAWGGDRG
jgi:hypothetical protein